MKRVANFIVFSKVIDENTDIKDVEQLSVFIRGVDEDLIVPEELLDVMILQDPTTADIFTTLML